MVLDVGELCGHFIVYLCPCDFPMTDSSTLDSFSLGVFP